MKSAMVARKQTATPVEATKDFVPAPVKGAGVEVAETVPLLDAVIETNPLEETGVVGYTLPEDTGPVGVAAALENEAADEPVCSG